MCNIMEVAMQSLTCYGQPQSNSITEAWQWGIEMCKGATSKPKLCALSPTTGAFKEHEKRTHPIFRHVCGCTLVRDLHAVDFFCSMYMGGPANKTRSLTYQKSLQMKMN